MSFRGSRIGENGGCPACGQWWWRLPAMGFPLKHGCLCFWCHLGGISRCSRSKSRISASFSMWRAARTLAVRNTKRSHEPPTLSTFCRETGKRLCHRWHLCAFVTSWENVYSCSCDHQEGPRWRHQVQDPVQPSAFMRSCPMWSSARDCFHYLYTVFALHNFCGRGVICVGGCVWCSTCTLFACRRRTRRTA